MPGVDLAVTPPWSQLKKYHDPLYNLNLFIEALNLDELKCRFEIDEEEDDPLTTITHSGLR
jgi:hypothetical protein